MLFNIMTLVAAALVVCVRSQILPSEAYNHSAVLKLGVMKLYWKFNDKYITFEVIAKTTGWVGIGFSEKGSMIASDIIVGWVKNGIVKITDRHGDLNGFPPLDSQQDIKILGGKQDGSWTMLKFSRQIASCETDYDIELNRNTQKVIWAYGNKVPIGDDITPQDSHGTNRGVKSLIILTSLEKLYDLPRGPEYKTFDVLANNVKIPAAATYYNCRIHRFPEFSKKHHIVKVEPIISEGNEEYAHHIALHRCGDVLPNKTLLELDDNCYSSNIKFFETCGKIIEVYTIGGESEIFPDIAGISVGAPGDPIYVQLEIHYNNPDLRSDIVDNSGLRFTYTSTLRKFDIGTSYIGVVPFGSQTFIPPGSESFKSIGQCNPTCLGDKMTTSGFENITIFSVILHSHLAARKARLRHFRNGTELPPIASDEHFDFNYQRRRYSNATVKNTEQLVMECEYNTKDRLEVTEAGFGTMKEMCFAIVYYYPLINLSYCFSSVQRRLSWSYLGVDLGKVKRIDEENPDLEAFVLTGPDKQAGKTILEYMNELDWNTKNISQFQLNYNAMEHYELCYESDRSNPTKTAFNLTKIANPYKESKRKCHQPDLDENESVST